MTVIKGVGHRTQSILVQLDITLFCLVPFEVSDANHSIGSRLGLDEEHTVKICPKCSYLTERKRHADEI